MYGSNSEQSERQFARFGTLRSRHFDSSGIDFLAANSVRVPWQVHVTSAKVVLSYLFMFTLDCLAFPVQPTAFSQDGTVVEQFQ